jgi:hypothetical protein
VAATPCPARIAPGRGVALGSTGRRHISRRGISCGDNSRSSAACRQFQPFASVNLCEHSLRPHRLSAGNPGPHRHALRAGWMQSAARQKYCHNGGSTGGAFSSGIAGAATAPASISVGIVPATSSRGSPRAQRGSKTARTQGETHCGGAPPFALLPTSCCFGTGLLWQPDLVCEESEGGMCLVVVNAGRDEVDGVGVDKRNPRRAVN